MGWEPCSCVGASVDEHARFDREMAQLCAILLRRLATPAQLIHTCSARSHKFKELHSVVSVGAISGMGAIREFSLRSLRVRA